MNGRVLRYLEELGVAPAPRGGMIRYVRRHIGFPYLAEGVAPKGKPMKPQLPVPPVAGVGEMVGRPVGEVVPFRYEGTAEHLRRLLSGRVGGPRFDPFANRLYGGRGRKSPATLLRRYGGLGG